MYIFGCVYGCSECVYIWVNEHVCMVYLLEHLCTFNEVIDENCVHNVHAVDYG